MLSLLPLLVYWSIDKRDTNRFALYPGQLGELIMCSYDKRKTTK